MSNNSAQQAVDIVSPITDGALPNTVSPADARKAGRFGHDKPTPQNSIVLLIDHQIGLTAGVRDFRSLAPFNHNLSECGFVLQNFWNKANQHVVPDPFGMVR
jgi:hypothetical protein